MDQITFSITCRTCRQTDGLRWSYVWDEQQEQASIKGRTDFTLMQVMEFVTSRKGTVCPFCDSPTLEISDLGVNGELVFAIEEMYQRYGPRGMCIFSVGVNKVASQLEVRLETLPTKVEGEFLALALDHMAELVGQRPASDFAADHDGTFYCCVSGRWDTHVPNQIMYTQKYTCRGLTREEVLFVIRSVRGNIEA